MAQPRDIVIVLILILILVLVLVFRSTALLPSRSFRGEVLAGDASLFTANTGRFLLAAL
jgi:hypothetical protein